MRDYTNDTPVPTEQEALDIIAEDALVDEVSVELGENWYYLFCLSYRLGYWAAVKG